MTARQIQKLNSYLSISLTCREHIAIIAMIPAMLRNVKRFDKLLSEILKTAESQALPITQHAIQKLFIRKQIAKIMSELACIIRSYCYEANDIIVLHKYQYTYSSLCRRRQEDFRPVCAYTINFLKLNLECFRDFGMKKTSLEQLIHLFEQYKKIYSIPRVSKGARIASTSILADQVKEIDFLLKHQMDTLLLSFRQFPEFCKAFKAARKQIKYGRPKEILKNKIKKYRAAPALPRTRKSSKPVMKLKPVVMPEMILPENIQESNSGS